jgi:hypothetical protein
LGFTNALDMISGLQDSSKGKLVGRVEYTVSG